MQWSLHAGDLLDVAADALVLSANVYLNLSGGVGGAFALRYGSAMQEALHVWLAERNLRHVPPGTVVAMPPLGSPYLAVLHAVGVDAMYATTPQLVGEVIERSLQIAADSGARTVALAAIGTGYGRLSMSQFAAAVEEVAKRDYAPLQAVVIGLRKQDDARELSTLLDWRDPSAQLERP
jgi:O-acetyl-ADP-ribose deacetylase (regulator of RNase III)